MPTTIVTNQLPRTMRLPVADAIVETTATTESDWQVSLSTDAKNNAWDVEVSGPHDAHWARRFSGEDRDAEVVAESVRSAVEELEEEENREESTSSPELNEALSSLVVQGIAFTEVPGHTPERSFVVDRVQLKESEIVYLHKRGALTVRGIPMYLLTRSAA